MSSFFSLHSQTQFEILEYLDYWEIFDAVSSPPKNVTKDFFQFNFFKVLNSYVEEAFVLKQKLEFKREKRKFEEKKKKAAELYFKRKKSGTHKMPTKVIVLFFLQVLGS
jgi:hypothetical protein